MEQFLRPVVSSYTGNSITGKQKTLCYCYYIWKKEKKKRSRNFEKNKHNWRTAKDSQFTEKKIQATFTLEALDLGSRYIFTLKPIYNKPIL